MLFAEACARGYLDAPVKRFISDGAGAISSLRDLHFCDARAIIDWYHAAEHLHDCATAAFVDSASDAQAWVEQALDALWNGRLREVIDAIGQQAQRLGPPPMKASDTDPRRVRRRHVGYFTERQNQMDYPTYRANGWPIGSGVAQGSVKQFGLRVKGSPFAALAARLPPSSAVILKNHRPLPEKTPREGWCTRGRVPG